MRIRWERDLSKIIEDFEKTTIRVFVYKWLEIRYGNIR